MYRSCLRQGVDGDINVEKDPALKRDLESGKELKSACLHMERFTRSIDIQTSRYASHVDPIEARAPGGVQLRGCRGSDRDAHHQGYGRSRPSTSKNLDVTL